MTHLKKTAILGMMACSFLFRSGTAQAIPIPTIGAELAVQIDQLTKHIDELKKIKDQVAIGIEQSHAMGNGLSMDALKNFTSNQSRITLSGGVKGIEVSPEMKAAGFTEDVMKDPEKIISVIERYQTDKNSSNKNKGDSKKRKLCANARESMSKKLTVSNLANSFALQQNLASGADMKKAQEAASAADDQMQLIGANTATLRVIYQQSATSTAMTANGIALSFLKALCE